ncbi:hypothetical protein T484DRAFT_1903959 [Baffinella frigidus]|nr:hypothetical protein T484DRAFT_1903959 [Cryptophyta sp. CCMP2293]
MSLEGQVTGKGTRTAIQKTVGALDDLKQLSLVVEKTVGALGDLKQIRLVNARVTGHAAPKPDGRRLGAWNSLDQTMGAAGFRGASSLEQLLKASAVAEGEADRCLGVNGFKALSTKNGALASALAAGGYGALVINVLLGLFSQQSNDWLARKLYQVDIDRYAERALVSEAAHLLVAWLCGVPLQEYQREHVGYPVRERPTGRAQVYSSRRGDPEVAPRMRPFGLPPWASLEKEALGDTILDGYDSSSVRNGYTQKEVDHLSLILLAGPVAEYLYFGEASNGAPCYQQLDTCMLMAQDAMSGERMQGQARWALIKLLDVVKQNKGRLNAVVEAMRREATVLEVIAAIESTPAGP